MEQSTLTALKKMGKTGNRAMLITMSREGGTRIFATFGERKSEKCK